MLTFMVLFIYLFLYVWYKFSGKNNTVQECDVLKCKCIMYNYTACNGVCVIPFLKRWGERRTSLYKVIFLTADAELFQL